MLFKPRPSTSSVPMSGPDVTCWPSHCHLTDRALVDGYKPRPWSPGVEFALDVVPAADQPHEVVPGAEILLAGDPEDAQPVLTKQRELGGLGPNVPIPRDNSEAAVGDCRHPVWVQSAGGNFWNQRMTRVNDVPTRDGQRFADSKCALINEEAETRRIGGHPSMRRPR